MSQQFSSCHLNQQLDSNHTLAGSRSALHDNHLFSACSEIFIISPENVLISHFLLINHLEFRLALCHFNNTIYQALGRYNLAVFHNIDRFILVTFTNICSDKFSQLIFFALAEYRSLLGVFLIAGIRYASVIHIIVHKHTRMQTYLSLLNRLLKIIEKRSIASHLITRMGGLLQPIFIMGYHQSILLCSLNMLPLFQLYHNNIGFFFAIQSCYDKVNTIIGYGNIIFQGYSRIIRNYLTIYNLRHKS